MIQIWLNCSLYSSCFEIPEATVNLQRRALYSSHYEIQFLLFFDRITG
ncbi:MAG: hypothetical protein LBJ00_00045 [Planctomycetaceae bacterium]|jgi:hypothetical protein|nr:hypothetical protein [Planctomycetaceae bacterium]